MGYRHGDLQFICDSCGVSLDVDIFSSFPIYKLIDNNWSYEIPQPFYKNKKFLFKEDVLPMIITCDLCKRIKKIKKIKSNIK